MKIVTRVVLVVVALSLAENCLFFGMLPNHSKICKQRYNSMHDRLALSSSACVGALHARDCDYEW